MADATSMGGTTCHKCAAPASLKCSKCHVARYCGVACQRAHWPTHKTACKIDSKDPAPDFEHDIFSIDQACLHGAPPGSSPSGKAAMSIATQLMPAIGRRDGSNELSILESFARASPAAARDTGAPRALASMALDAFGDNNGGISRAYLRAAIFLEEFAEHGNAFLDALHSEGSSHILTRLTTFLDNTTSRKGMLEAIRARTSCKCLTVKKI